MKIKSRYQHKRETGSLKYQMSGTLQPQQERRMSLALIKSERLVEVLPPSCDLCSSTIEARVTVETAEHGAQQMNLCARHIDHLRQYIGVERWQAQRESEVA